jgi:small subunit ribosomal protein S9
MENSQTVGRRKEATARITLTQGDGTIIINGKTLEQYFPLKVMQTLVLQPLVLLDVLKNFNVVANVRGGGTKGQAEAIRLGISRALVKNNPESKPALRAKGLVTRDPRAVERKKPGRKKARKRFQFTKR